jgi:Protein of unknown function (DUF3379)
MTCDEARLLIGADPSASSAGLEEHVRGCAACAQLRREMQALDDEIFRALQQPPEMARAAPPRQAPEWRRWALAASAALATFAVFAVWLLRPSDTLAHDVVTHVQGEPDSWLATQQVSADELNHALSGAGVALHITSDKVVYAQSCWFHGHYVPHLVVQTAHGPTTVMILRHEQVSGRRSFHEADMSGVIVPAEHGSIAVVARGRGEVNDLVGQLGGDVQWMAEPPPAPPPTH